MQCHLTLERVLGITARSNNMISVNRRTGEIAYVAGCIVVIYNLRRNRQIRYYRVEQSITSVVFSPDGKYLAISEYGDTCAITVWDFEMGELYAEFRLESYRVVCMAFSHDNSYVVSVGVEKDHLMYVWKIGNDSKNPIGAAEVHERVFGIDFSNRGNYFVTVGEQHVRFWCMEANHFQMTGKSVKTIPELRHRKANMSAKEESTFTSVTCGFGENDGKVYALTSDGVLCAFGIGGALERIVSLESSKGFSVAASEAYVIVGGASSVVRLFDPSTLAYRGTLPFPPAFGKANEPYIESKKSLVPEHPHRYPLVTAVVVTGCHAVVLYSNRFLFVYQISDLENIALYRSFVFHSGRITDLRAHGRAIGVSPRGRMIYEHQATDISNQTSINSLPNCTFVSCSEDNTMRFWHLELHKSLKKGIEWCNSKYKCPYSQEMLRVVYYEAEDERNPPQYVSDGTWKMPCFRTLAIRPDGTQVAAGDTRGKIAIFDVSQADIIQKMAAHSSEVLCLNYSHGNSSYTSDLLASGGKDHRACIFDAQNSYIAIGTGKPTGSAIKGLEVIAETMRLITSSSDNKVVLSDLKRGDHNTKLEIQPYNSIAMDGGPLRDMHLMNDNVRVVTCCSDKLAFHYLEPSSTIKQTKAVFVGEQNRFAICPANYCAALSGSSTPPYVQIVEITTGNVLAEVGGHDGEITGLQFLPDGRRLVSSSSDGCIFVWRLSQYLQQSIRSRLPRLKATGGNDPDGDLTTLPRAKRAIPHAINPGQNDATAPPAPSSTKNEFEELMQNAKSGLLGKMREDLLRNLHGTIRAHPTDSNAKDTNIAEDRFPLVSNMEMISKEYTTDDGAVCYERGFENSKGQNGDLVGFSETTKAEKMATKDKAQMQVDRPYVRVDDKLIPISSLSAKSDLMGTKRAVKSTNVLSTSLALERDQLERRKRQMETANAVAAMNSRLSQLGLLKLKQIEVSTEKISKPSPTHSLTGNSREKRVEFVNLSVELNPVEAHSTEGSSHLNATVCDRPSSNRTFESLEKLAAPCKANQQTLLHSITSYSKKKYEDSLPSELLESIEARKVINPSVKESFDETITRRPILEKPHVLSDATDLKEDYSNSDDDSDQNENSDEESTSQVDNQLSSGETYRNTNFHQAPNSQVNEEVVEQYFTENSSINRSIRKLDLSSTNVSLSLYTAGYTRTPTFSDLGTSIRTRQSLDSLPVDVSISAFTVGYTNLNSALPLTSYRNEKSMMESSLSVFTSGYTEENAFSNQTVTCVNEAVGNLPSIVAPSNINRSQAISSPNANETEHTCTDRVSDAEICANTLSDAMLRVSQTAVPVDVSLSQFTTGYKAMDKEVECTDITTVTSDALKSSRILESIKQQLEVAIPITQATMEQSLSTSGSQDTQLREIFDLMSRLREKIAVRIFFADE
ncbi:unnamed protein product [Albugo candida]|nr:unnamed protein product [Albugo candida]|eukprot:CCI39870.1 unnamed protein product [Albugo candida]